MGLFSGIASIIGGSKQKKASKKAEAAQLGYLNQALDFTKQTDARTQGQLQPFLQSGTAALGEINDLLGLSTPGTTDWAAYVQGNPDALANWQAIQGKPEAAQFGGDIAKFGQFHYGADGSRRDLGSFATGGSDGDQAAAIAELQASPLYQSLIRNGEEAVLQNNSATGGLRGGNIQTGLANFRADTLTQTIENQLQRLGGIAGMGQNAVNSAGQFGADTASAVSNIFGQQGQVRAGGLLTRGGITAGQMGAIGGIADSIAGAAKGGGGIGGFLKGLI